MNMPAPTTAFEESGDTTWTTIAEGEQFLADVAAQSSRVKVSTLGRSTNDTQDVQLVTVKMPYTSPRAPAILMLSLQHGNEPAGREMVLQTIRDLAVTDDPALVDLMGRCRLHFIPAANPSGFPNSRNVPSSGLNMNREHATAAVEESRIVQQLITDIKPVMVVDAHEYFSTFNPYEVLVYAGRHAQADGEVSGLAAALVSHLRGELDSRNIGNRLYADPTSIGTLRTVGTLRHAVSLLIETPANVAQATPAIRVEWQIACSDIVLRWLADNLDAVTSASKGARGRKAFEGGRGVTTFDLTVLNPGGISLSPPPISYHLPSSAISDAVLHTFGIRSTTEGGTTTVPMGQEGQPLIPFLMDPEWDEAPIDGAMRMLGTPSFEGVPSGFRVRLDGVVYDVESVKVRLAGVTYDAMLPGT